MVQKLLFLLHFNVLFNNDLPKVLSADFFCSILIVKDLLLELNALAGTFSSVFIGRYLGLSAS